VGGGAGYEVCTCHQDCPAGGVAVCASDGHVYENRCLVEVRACEGDVHLEVMPHYYCTPGQLIKLKQLENNKSIYFYHGCFFGLVYRLIKAMSMNHVFAEEDIDRTSKHDTGTNCFTSGRPGDLQKNKHVWPGAQSSPGASLRAG
jgi:hypothetical protein